MAKLRIIKRNDKYVVQIGVKRKFVFALDFKWIDLEEHFKRLQIGKTTRGYKPFPFNTIFSNQDEAEKTCIDYLIDEEIKEQSNGKVCKTYNTNLEDIFYNRTPPMPK